MPFDLAEMPNRRRCRVVAVLLKGRGDGTSDVTPPVATDATRQHGYVNFGHRTDRGHLEGSGSERCEGDAEGLLYDSNQGESLDYARGGGQACGILILGKLVPGESDAAGVARLGQAAPDAAAIWRNHCSTVRLNGLDIEESLRSRVEEGFGSGTPMRFR